MKIQTKRAYELVEPDDGYRILVDRIWPRGVAKTKLQCDVWLKDIAPSSELRKWFDHDPKKWTEFKTRYYTELNSKQDLVTTIIAADKMTVTLIYAAKEERFNNAVALKIYIDNMLQSSRRKTLDI